MISCRIFCCCGLALLLALPSLTPAHAQSKSSANKATIIHVQSGDIVQVQMESKSDDDAAPVTVHLAEIDAPAGSQRFADESLKLTRSLLPEGTAVSVTLLPRKKTDPKNAVPQALIILNDKTDIAMELLREGLAWWAWQDAGRTSEERTQQLADLERQARISRLGVFSLDNPIAPGNYRLGARTGGGQTIHRVDVEGKPTDVLRTSDCVIIALMPNPRGADDGHESVTLGNRSQEAISLDGWSLHDDDGGAFALSGKLDAGGSLTIVLDDQLQLGNNGDTVWLAMPGNKLAHAVSYATSRSGQFVPVQ